MKTELKHVRAGDLEVDYRVQRELEASHVKKLIKNWDDRCEGALIISEREDGTLYVIDGHHRASAMKGHDPDHKFAAVVHTGLTLVDEAFIFNRINDARKNVRPYQKFKTYLAEGDPLHQSLQEVLERCDLSIGKTSTANQVGAVNALTIVIKRVGPDGLERVLRIAEAAWRRSPKTWDGYLLQAISLLVAKGADTQRLIEVLQKNEPKSWALLNASGNGGGTQAALGQARLFVAAYNKGLRSRRIEL